MEVKHCKAHHEVLVTFIRYTVRSIGPWNRPPLSYWNDGTERRANLHQMTPDLKLVLTRARTLSEERHKPTSPLQAALLHAKWSGAFTDILREIQWCVSVVSRGRLRRDMRDKSAPRTQRFSMGS